MKRAGADDALRCSFCRKSQDVVIKLISSPSDPRAYICDECVAVCNSILEDDRAEPKVEAGITLSLSLQPQQEAGLQAMAQAERLSMETLIREILDVTLASEAYRLNINEYPGPATGLALAAAMQASPHPEIEIEPKRSRLPARDLEL